MNFMNKIPRKYLYMFLGAAALMAAAAFFMLNGSGTKKNQERSYGTYVESKLADDVIMYLSSCDALDDAGRAELADYSVQTYNMVLQSGTDTITDEHSAALAGMFKEQLTEYADGLPDADIDALSDGISSYVWEAVLLSLEIYKKGDMAPDYEGEYLALAESLQQQIDALEEKKMNIHITARLKEDEEAAAAASKETEAVFTRYMNGALNTVNTGIDKRIDDMESDITKIISSEVKSNVADEMDSMKSDITSELKNSIKNGTNGKDGKDGASGRDGRDGKNGEDGQDGKSTYIAYADDASGRGFSLTPTETSKYIGTCVTTADRQPTSASSYSNWQLYRNYIITSTTDENNNTTLYIK